jgi:hypothetical protein
LAQGEKAKGNGRNVRNNSKEVINAKPKFQLITGSVMSDDNTSSSESRVTFVIIYTKQSK